MEILERERRHLQRQLSQLQTTGERERVRTDSLGSHVDSDRSESDRGGCSGSLHLPLHEIPINIWRGVEAPSS